MKTTQERKDVYSIINSMILEKLQQNMLPWKQPWNKFGPARNYVSGKAYRGINAMLLNHTQSEYPLFLTFNQVKDLGGHIKKGSKGNIVVFWKKLYYGNSGKIDLRKIREYAPEDIKTIPFLRYYYVFNIDSIEGVEFEVPAKNLALQPLENCERIIEQMPNSPAIEHGGDQPSYNKVDDKIKVPHLSNFKSEEEYYATVFHELSHSTGHPSRLNRDMSGNYGSKQYSFEELIAEAAACSLCNESGIADQIIDNSIAYIKAWLERLTFLVKEDDKFLVRAFAQAQRATDYILNRLPEEVGSEEAKIALELEEKGA
ncbi:MAG TPA: zincin-like metallopeptidase domain-containing protein [Chryseolinea sp.]|nr:zincin-like metallopeptidase domain-containing protein [Chryseolinea sp.]